MKQIFVRKTYVAFLFTGMLSFSACHSSYELVGIDGGRVEINSAYDAHPDEAAVKMLAPYKAKVDSVMSPVIGHSEVAMSAERPESLLSDFSADVIRLAAIPYQGKPADVAITNMGGLRNSLPQGDVTFGNVYEIFPFENSLCLLTMNGKSLMDLFVQIAKLGGEGLSGARLVITKDGKLKDAKINGQEIDPDKLYTVATLDYLAEGNDGMTAFLEATERVCPEKATIRQIIVNYIEEMEKKGKSVTAALDGRITVE